MKKIFSAITGGRPMKRLDYAFTDFVSGERVFKFEDTNGRLFLACHAWSIFRSEIKCTQK